MEGRTVVPEITLDEEEPEAKRRRAGEGEEAIRQGKEPGAGRAVKQMSRAELEALVGRKVEEAVLAQGHRAELVRRVGRLEVENAALKERAEGLGGQLDALAEVASRGRRLETEGRGLQVPKVAHSVGQQVGDLAMAPPAVSSEEIVLDSDEEAEETDGEEPLQLAVRRAAGDGSGVVVQWAGRPAAALDYSLVRGYELEGRQGGRARVMVGPAIRPLPLPMACKLDGFRPGSTCSFRVKMIHIKGIFFSDVATINM
jgi:hypothetical protein